MVMKNNHDGKWWKVMEDSGWLCDYDHGQWFCDEREVGKGGSSERSHCVGLRSPPLRGLVAFPFLIAQLPSISGSFFKAVQCKPCPGTIINHYISVYHYKPSHTITYHDVPVCTTCSLRESSGHLVWLGLPEGGMETSWLPQDGCLAKHWDLQ